jgi:hypothetical protein
MGGIITLPEQARLKLIELQLAAQDAADGIRGVRERINQLSQDADPLMVQRLQQRAREQSQRHTELMALVNSCKSFLNHLPSNVVLELVEPAKVELGEGERLADAIERTRDEIATLQHRRDAVSNAPLPAASLRKLAADHVKKLAERGAPVIEIRKDKLLVQFTDPQRMDAVSALDDAVAAMAWIAPDLLIKKIEQHLDALPQRADALPADERTKRTAELSAQIELLERSEVALIEQAAAEGVLIPHREDISPPALLGVRLQRRAAQAVA